MFDFQHSTLPAELASAKLICERSLAGLSGDEVDVSQRRAVSRVKHSSAAQLQSRLHLTGPMQLIAADGRDCTPGGQVRKALLAVLATSPQGVVTRARLMDLLWSDRPKEKASGTLRTALHAMRAELAPLGGELVVADPQNVTLDLSRVDIVSDPALGVFLDGIDLPSGGAEAFEDWLRNERSRLCPPEPETPGIASRHDADTALPALGIVWRVPGEPQPFEVDVLLDAIAHHVSDQIGCPVYDYRNVSQADRSAGQGPTVLLGLVGDIANDHITLNARALRASDDRLLWSQRFGLARVEGDPLTSDAAASVVLNISERLVDTLSRHNRIATPFHILKCMFSDHGGALARGAALLKENWTLMREEDAQALLLYLETLRRGERWNQNRLVAPDEVAPILRKVLASSSDAGALFSAAGYAAHYLGAPEDIAHDMLETAVERSPLQAFCWDHLALFYYHRNEVSLACAAAEKSIAWGTRSPLRPVYETTRAMVAFAQGDFETAARFGERALARQPNLSAALRYTSASLAHLGRTNKARSLNAQIRALAPGFRAERIEAGLFRTANPDVAAALAAGLRKGGLE